MKVDRSVRFQQIGANDLRTLGRWVGQGEHDRQAALRPGWNGTNGLFMGARSASPVANRLTVRDQPARRTTTGCTYKASREAREGATVLLSDFP
mgnify:FL=1